MYDRSRASPQPIPNYHPSSSPIPPQLRPNENNIVIQPFSSPNPRMPQRNTGLNRSSTMVLPYEKPVHQLDHHAISDHGHTRLYDHPSALQPLHPPPSSRPDSRNGPPSTYSEDKSSPVSQSAPSSSFSQTHSNHSTSTISTQPCSSCGLTMSGQFVRALGNVYHLDCFRCRDCNCVVAQKFFPVEGQDGKQYPLCERDYFKRLNLICAKCDQALRASYITACGKKYHVEHFTCSVCPTLFGPQDSYYEHEGNVFCHFHYSTRFATKCVGCASAILKQFVEINRNMRDECWHPECYMIHKFWSVKLRSRRAEQPLDPSQQSGEQPAGYLQEEQDETPESLREKQVKTEKQVSRIWSFVYSSSLPVASWVDIHRRVLSSFEESSAACISDMLRHVSNGYYLEAVRMAEKFILHVETLFATIDDLETHFARLSSKGMSHVREARLLCRKTVDLFTLLSHTQETGERRVGMTQELLALVTGLAHYLKILIRIALTGALKLERDHGFSKGLSSFLEHLQSLSSNKANPSVRRLKAENSSPDRGCASTQGVIYGYKSLAPEIAGETPFSTQTVDSLQKQLPTPYDLCMECKITVEEDCVRLGTYRRWHSHCVKCKACGKAAAPPLPHKENSRDEEDKEGKELKDVKELKDGKEVKPPPKVSTSRRPPALVDEFLFEPVPLREGTTPAEVPIAAIYCVEHSHAGCDRGFQAVTRLEQYAFLLNVALRRLYIVLKRRGVIPMSPAAAAAASEGQTEQSGFGNDAYRSPSDAVRMNSIAALDRKLSATSRVPKHSTVVESPPGRVLQTSEARVGGDTTSNANQKQSQPQLQLSPSIPPSQLTLKQPQPRSAAAASMSLPTPLVPGRHPASSTPLPTGSGPPVIPWNPPSSPIEDSRLRHQGYFDEPHHPPVSPSVEDSPHSRIQPEWSLDDVPRLVAADVTAQRQALQRHSRSLIAELSPLELAIIKHAAVLALWRSPLRDQFDLDEILDMVELKKSGWWGKIFKGNADKKNKNTKKGAVFGVPLEQLVERQGADSLLGASSQEPLRVPTFIDDVVSAMRQMDMSVEGIFRKNGNIRRLKDLSDAIDRDPQSVDLTQDNAVQLAALLKKFLRDLPEPLLTVKLFKLFTASQMLPSLQERQRCLHYISLILPKSHRDTLEVLFVFLKWVASFAHVDEETGSKMDLANLATVICPSILYGKGRDTAHTESVLAIPVVTELLVNQDEFWQVPEEFLPMLQEKEYFANSLDLSSKDFMKRCEAFLRARASGRQLPSGGLISPPPLTNGHSGSVTPRIDSSEVRLVQPQRSDPAMARGRVMPSDPPRPPNSSRYIPDSQSLEREWPQGSPSKGGLLPPPLVHQPYSQPLPQGKMSDPLPVPSLSDADWAATQRPPPPITGGLLRSRSNSRPGSFESSPASSNGRHSPRL